MNRSKPRLKLMLGAVLSAALSATAVAGTRGYAPGDDVLSVQGSIVASRGDAECRPPSSSVACAQFHDEIRRSFSTREIGMLFGAATSYPEFRTSYSRVQGRYERLRSELALDYGQPAKVASH